MTEPAIDRAVGANAPEFTVSELSGALKRTVEDAFGQVRVRGELGPVKVHSSGHLYATLKDADAVIDAVMWRPSVGKLAFRPEEGLEVVAEGRLTTYPGRSKYQIVIERMSPAGAGALMALLDARKKTLAAEGLFAAERKRAIPFLPEVVGVVTSPTGAVIRDILHRIAERFPRRVIVWPVLVQGEGAADQVAKAIAGFNRLQPGGDPPRPDLLIVARGGGSIEDLWTFNEEIVVRAAAASAIPLISAVGHETDTTLIDLASDHRAPTPTAAAERAVPVRVELAREVKALDARLAQGLGRLVEARRTELRAAVRGLPRAEDLIGARAQRLDAAGAGLRAALKSAADRAQIRFQRVGARLRPEALNRDIGERRRRVEEADVRARAAALRVLARLGERLEARGVRLAAQSPRAAMVRAGDRLNLAASRLAEAGRRDVRDRHRRLEAIAGRLEALNPKAVLQRGFVLVRNADGLVGSAGGVTLGDRVALEFHDGTRDAVIGDAAVTDTGAIAPRRGRKDDAVPPRQGALFD